MTLPSIDGLRRRKRLRFFTLAAACFASGWFIFFFGVALGGTPAIFLFPLAVSSIASFFVAWNVLPDVTSPASRVAEMFLVAMNVLLVIITMGALFVAAYAVQKDLDYAGGLYLAGANLLVHVGGGIGNYAQTDIDMEDYHRLENEMLEKRREEKRKQKQKKIEEQT